MTKEYIEIYKKLLFSKDLKTYAIIDGLRDEEINDKIFLTNLSHMTLWHDDIVDDTDETPLYLVELKKEDELLDLLLKKHEKGIATYFQTPYDLSRLQKYYSTFTYPQIEVEKDDFKKGIFGFYDPNILANYLETLYTDEKVDEFFAGIALWFTPKVEDETLAHLAYRTKRGGFESVSLMLQNFLDEENISLNFDNISLPTIENLEYYAQNRVIDNEQIKLFEKIEVEKFIDAVFEEFKENNEPFMKNEWELRNLALTQFYPKAKGLGLSTEAGIYLYILLCCLNMEYANNQKVHSQIEKHVEEFKKINFLKKIIEEHKTRET